MALSKRSKRIPIVAGVLACVLLLTVLLVSALLEAIVERGIRAAGPPLLGVQTRLDDARIRPLAGEVELRGLFIGNPEGFSSPSFMQAGRIKVGANVAALFHKEVHLREVLIDGPEFTLESKGLGSDWNYQRVLDHLGKKKESKPRRDESRRPGKEKEPVRLKIDLVRVTNVRVNVVVAGKKLPSLTIDEITLRNLSENGKAVPPERIILKVIREVVAPAEKMIDLAELRGEAGEALETARDRASRAAREAREGVSGALEGVRKGVGDLLGKPAKRSDEER